METNNWLNEAYSLAEFAGRMDEVPIGAVVVFDGRIVGRGHNRREADHDPTSHAEILAIQEAARNLASWRLVECDLFVTLEPCPMCLAACQQARVRNVFYGTPDIKGGAISLGYLFHQDERTNHRFVVKHMDHEPSRTILKDFFKSKR